MTTTHSRVLGAALFLLAGCTVECHTSSSTSTRSGSSSGSEQPASHSHEHPTQREPQPQAGRGDSVRVVSTDRHPSGGDGSASGGRTAGDGDGGRRVVHTTSGPAPSNSDQGGGSSGQPSGADNTDRSGGSSSSDQGNASSDAGGSAAGQGDSSAEAGASGRTPTRKREPEPHIARPVKKRPAKKGEGHESNEGGSSSKGSGRE